MNKKRNLFLKSKNKRNFFLSMKMLEMTKMHTKAQLMTETALSAQHAAVNLQKKL